MDALLCRYRNERRKFYARHGARWPGTLADEFDILAPCPLSRAEADEILNATASLARIYDRAAQLLRRVSDQALLEMGVPRYLLPAVRCAIPGMTDCVVGRFDLARTEHGYKLLEFNADVAGLLVEAFSINREVCRDAGNEDPNESGERDLVYALTKAVQAGLKYVGKKETDQANVVVTSCGRCIRDVALAQYLCRLLEAFPARYSPIESLSIDAEGLYDPRGNRIDVLYRAFPLRFIRNEIFHPRETPMDPQMGGLVLRFVERQQLAIINPPFSFLLENKALQAVIWNLFESGQYFAEDESQLISRFMLPTYLDPPSDNTAYVVKPAYGAEGDTVKVMSHGGRVLYQSSCATHDDGFMVYQKHVDLMPSEMMTEYGPRTLHVVTSAFVLAGKPSGICMRAGSAITDDSAWVLPVCISKEDGTSE
jgi:glutathionylspermidine synthase